MDPATPGQYGGYQPPPAGGGGAGIAMGKVSGPAIGLMITAAIGICVQILNVLVQLLGMGIAASQAEGSPFSGLVSGPIVIVFGFVGVVIGIFILFGAMKMKNLESYSMAMVATILAMIPCISPCCILGLPIGIWSLIVLMSPEVKAAFRS